MLLWCGDAIESLQQNGFNRIAAAQIEGYINPELLQVPTPKWPPPPAQANPNGEQILLAEAHHESSIPAGPADIWRVLSL
jgi:hypothetical protein